MLTYQNDPNVKEMFQQRFADHRKADEVVQGVTYKNGRGCFIGCTMNAYSHQSFANQIGPEWLARLAEAIFEGLPKEEAPQFGTDLLEAIPVGADVEKVRHICAIARLSRLLKLFETGEALHVEKCRAAIQGVVAYCEAVLAGTATEKMREKAYKKAVEARRSAAEAAEGAAWSAVQAAARATAESARRAAAEADAAAEAAWEVSTGSPMTAEAARTTAYQAERDTLLAALRAVKA